MFLGVQGFRGRARASFQIGLSGLDRLEAAGLVARSLDPADRRSFRVVLSEKGRQAVDAVLPEHAANLARLASALTPEQSETLEQALRTLLRAVE